jgi:L-asparaginase / beta-aspartyl-peptidase
MPSRPAPAFGLAIHGGAGTLLRSEITADRDREIRDGLREALARGKTILESGGQALDAVEAAVVALEECPFFNAGRGAVLNREGEVELDASIMDGRDRRAGAVACIRGIRNPVRLARLVMEHSGHVLLVGRGAEAYAAEHGLETAPMEHFITERRLREWERFRHTFDQPGGPTLESAKFGTVGAVALDRHGNLAAATSTGGLTGKRPGRAGDTPIVGAGVYAQNQTCAVSCTGHGEAFTRTVAAREVAALMQHRGLGLAEAARRVVFEELPAIGGQGGLIAIDRRGRISLPFNTPGMYRGYLGPVGEPIVGIYADDTG